MENLEYSTAISLSEITPRQSSSLGSQGKFRHFHQEDVFPLMLKETCEKAEELESLGKQFSKRISKTRGLRHSSNEESKDYGEILSSKGLFVEKLTEVVEEALSTSLDGPKYTVHYYNQFSSILKSRCEETQQGIQQNTEFLKEQKLETSQLVSQNRIFTNFFEEENEDLRNEEFQKAALQFQEAKSDLDKVLHAAFPEDEERKAFVSVMSELVEAHINNFESEEDQYIEIQSQFSGHCGLQYLMLGNVIVQHPKNQRKFRLCIED